MLRQRPLETHRTRQGGKGKRQAQQLHLLLGQQREVDAAKAHANGGHNPARVFHHSRYKHLPKKQAPQLGTVGQDSIEYTWTLCCGANPI